MRVLSDNGAAFLKGWEKLKLFTYLDSRGVVTGGWGHTGWYSLPDEEPLHLQLGQTLDIVRANRWFTDDTAKAVRTVDQFAPTWISQNKFDALVSFTYNVGIAAFAHSTLLRFLKMGDYVRTADEFLKWDYTAGVESVGLENRRVAEKNLFLTITGVNHE